MSRPGLVSAIRIKRHHAAVFAGIIDQGTTGVNLASSPFTTLPSFEAKLKAALRRRTDRIAMSTVNRQEAEAAFEYVMIFLHPEAPEILSIEQMESLVDVQVDLATVLF